MTRGDIVSYVCSQAQMLGVNDVNDCQGFVSKRYELIYNSYLWKDSLAMVDLNYDPVNNPDNASGILVLPTMIDRVVAVRNASNAMRVNSLELYYRIDWDRFQDVSDLNGVMEFAILNPIWKTIRPTTTTVLNLASVDYTGGNPVLGIPPVATISGLTVGDHYVLVSGVNEVGALFTDGSFGANITHAGQVVAFTAQGSSVSITASNPSVNNQPVTCTLTDVPLIVVNGTNSIAGSTATISSDNIADLGSVTVKVAWRDETDRYVVSSTLPLTLTPADGKGFIEVESVFKPTTAGNLTLTLNNPVNGYTYSSTVGTIAPTVLSSPSYQRIRLFSQPNGALTISVLGKKPFVPLTMDQEVPAIRNLDNCLIAFALGDMLKLARQYGKANLQMQEGSALLAELAKLETLQAANCERFVPDQGYGDPFFAPSSNRGIWA